MVWWNSRDHFYHRSWMKKPRLACRLILMVVRFHWICKYMVAIKRLVRPVFVDPWLTESKHGIYEGVVCPWSFLFFQWEESSLRLCMMYRNMAGDGCGRSVAEPNPLDGVVLLAVVTKRHQHC